MPQYRYQAFTRRGDLVEGLVDAESHSGIADLLWAQGLTVFDSREAADSGGQPWWRREILSSPHLKPAELAAFTRDLALMQQAEIPLDDALRMQADQGRSERVRRIARDMLGEVLDGSPLSGCMARRPRSFGLDYVGVVRAGEIGARTPQVLAELADLLDQRLEARAKIASALVYPCILIVMALASVALILSVLIPTFAPIFAESGQPLPSGIAALVALRDHWIEVTSGIALGVLVLAGLGSAIARNSKSRHIFDGLVLRIPLVGSVLAQREVARFARTLATLLRAGVPLLQGLESAKTTIGNRSLAQDIGSVAEHVREGEGLSTSLRRVKFMPPVALQMIAVGEQARRLEEVLLRIASMFETETRRRMDRAMTVLTPVLTILISGVVGGLIFTVMNAILSINDLAAQ